MRCGRRCLRRETSGRERRRLNANSNRFNFIFFFMCSVSFFLSLKSECGKIGRDVSILTDGSILQGRRCVKRIDAASPCLSVHIRAPTHKRRGKEGGGAKRPIVRKVQNGKSKESSGAASASASSASRARCQHSWKVETNFFLVVHHGCLFLTII